MGQNEHCTNEGPLIGFSVPIQPFYFRLSIIFSILLFFGQKNIGSTYPEKLKIEGPNAQKDEFSKDQMTKRTKPKYLANNLIINGYTSIIFYQRFQ